MGRADRTRPRTLQNKTRARRAQRGWPDCGNAAAHRPRHSRPPIKNRNDPAEQVHGAVRAKTGQGATVLRRPETNSEATALPSNPLYAAEMKTGGVAAWHGDLPSARGSASSSQPPEEVGDLGREEGAGGGGGAGCAGRDGALEITSFTPLPRHHHPDPRLPPWRLPLAATPRGQAGRAEESKGQGPFARLLAPLGAPPLPGDAARARARRGSRRGRPSPGSVAHAEVTKLTNHPVIHHN